MVHCVVVTICTFSVSKALDTGSGGTIADDGNCANDGCGLGFLGGLPRLGRSARAEPVSIIMQWDVMGVGTGPAGPAVAGPIIFEFFYLFI